MKESGGKRMNELVLNNGYKIPMIGIGTAKVGNLSKVLPMGLKLGYRLIDTAINYGNEEEIGEIIQEYREKVFLVSKIQISCHGYEETLKAVENSLRRLRTKYIDLMLIHQPYGDIYGEWRALEELYLKGKLKAIGVSNFNSSRLMDLCIHSTIKPMVNQIELHPYFQQKEIVELCRLENILIQAWSPLGQGKIDFSKEEVLMEIAKCHKKTIQEVILRWHIQNGIIPLPRTQSLEHLKKNINIDTFELLDEEMDRINNLDRGRTFFQDHNDANVVKLLSVLVNNNDEAKKLNISDDYLEYVFGDNKRK